MLLKKKEWSSKTKISKTWHSGSVFWIFILCYWGLLKGTLMQIWKSANIFVFIWKEYVEKHLLCFEICGRKDMGKVCLQTCRNNNLQILRIKKVKFSEYCFYMITIIKGDFQICISVPLNLLLLGSIEPISASQLSVLLTADRQIQAI